MLSWLGGAWMSAITPAIFYNILRSIVDANKFCADLREDIAGRFPIVSANFNIDMSWANFLVEELSPS